MRANLVIAVIAVVAASTPPRPADAPLPPIDPTRLPHQQHAQIACTGCHRPSHRPGADDHKPCDDGACHQKQFLGTPGLFCQVCHKPITTEHGLSAPLRDDPTDDAWQTEPPRFSHAQHMDAGRMEGRVGFHVSCVDCHTRGDGTLRRPDHTVCSRCHAAETALPGAPHMGDCVACHEGGAQIRTRKRLITGDLKFDHPHHLTDRRNQPIKCEACHTQSAQATGYSDHAAPHVASCVGCHDDSDRTPSSSRMRICETCHTNRTDKLTALAPRNHLPLTERPIDHTIAFRRDHAEAAERGATRCAACHTQMSGNPRQACDECHQTMEPADHRITWRELDHGADAAADHERCARCHVAEFCTACHALRPRSHGFRGTFLTEHGQLARVNVRACRTCHGESFCAQCHVGATARPVRK